MAFMLHVLITFIASSQDTGISGDQVVAIRKPGYQANNLTFF